MRVGTAQSFLESIDNNAPTRNESRQRVEEPTDVGSCACCCRCGRVQKWRLGPRPRRSQSYAALRTGISELSGWEGEPTTAAPIETPKAVKSYGAGQAPLEVLPFEILGKNTLENSITVEMAMLTEIYRWDHSTACPRRCPDRIWPAER